jgi:hypothetical protein
MNERGHALLPTEHACDRFTRRQDYTTKPQCDVASLHTLCDDYYWTRTIEAKPCQAAELHLCQQNETLALLESAHARSTQRKWTQQSEQRRKSVDLTRGTCRYQRQVRTPWSGLTTSSASECILHERRLRLTRRKVLAQVFDKCNALARYGQVLAKRLYASLA